MRVQLLICRQAAVIGLILLFVAASYAAPKTKPNLVLFLSDDHGYADSSLAGAAEFHTPNLQRLADAGMTFTNAFAASPTCAPSRAALLTGLMPARNGAMLNHQPPRADVKKLPAYLKELGYEVVAFGKVAHYEQGQHYGFDRVSHDGFHDDQCVPAAIEFLKRRSSTKPLCLFVGTNWPHVPWPNGADEHPPRDFVPPPTHTDTPETREWRARFAAAVERFDDDLGRVYDTAFEELGSNTLFLHFSDNGPQWPLAKWNLYDAGTRVPFFAVWPGVVRPYSRSNAMVSLVDILPTLVEAAGGKPPSDLDGLSFADALSGTRTEHRRQIFTTHSGDGRMNAYPMRSVRTREWKYIRNLQPNSRFTTHIDQGTDVDGNAYWMSWLEKAKTDPRAAGVVERYFHRPAEELYHLQNDPLEQHNLASNPLHSSTLTQLGSRLDTWMKQQGDEGLPTEHVATANLARSNLERKPNVLFIAIDDLRPLLGCYGHAEMVTPSLDGLARQGRRFNRHYAQVPTCGASRCALLTGQYPGLPAAYDNRAFETLPRTEADCPVSLPRLFQQNGYKTISIGKITHSPDGRRLDGTHELPFSWDETGVPHGKWNDAWAAFFAYAGVKTRIIGESSVSEQADVPDNAYPDGLIADAAIEKLRELKDERFFLAVGFFKPHLPFNAPTRYWDLYDPSDLPPPPNTEPPKNVDPAISLHHSGEMRGQYTGFSQPGIVTGEEARHLRHAYRACVSYVDAQVGRVLAELEVLGLAENTVVVVWGDHGWHLGEHGIWGKHTLYDVALRSPLIIRTPDMQAPGTAAGGLVESVDIYPTLSELCDLQAPSDLDGQSFVPMLEDPTASGKSAVYGFWRNGRGHSIRTPQYRLMVWTNDSDTSRVEQIELYDEQRDPNETQNIATQHPDIVRELSRQLRETAPLLRGN